MYVFKSSNPGFVQMTKMEPLKFSGSVKSLDKALYDKILSSCRYAISQAAYNNELQAMNLVLSRTIASVMAEDHVAKNLNGQVYSIPEDQFVGADAWTWAFDVVSGPEYGFLRVEVKVSTNDRNNVIVDTGWEGPYKARSFTKGLNLRGTLTTVPDLYMIFTGTHSMTTLDDVSINIQPFLLAATGAFDKSTNLIKLKNDQWVINNIESEVSCLDAIHYFR